MPWKVFTLSLALTNFGGKLANDQFIQRQKCLLLPKYSPKGKHPTPMTIQLHPQCLLGIQGILRNWTFLIFKQV